MTITEKNNAKLTPLTLAFDPFGSNDCLQVENENEYEMRKKY